MRDAWIRKELKDWARRERGIDLVEPSRVRWVFQFNHIVVPTKEEIVGKGLSLDLLHELASAKPDVERIRQLVQSPNNEGAYRIIVIIKDRPILLVETKFFDLPQEWKDILISGHVSFLFDDLICDFGITKTTRNLPYGRGCAVEPMKGHFGDAVISGNVFEKFEPDLKEYYEFEQDCLYSLVNVPSNVTSVRKGAFEGVSSLLIRYEGNVSDWLNAQVEEGALPREVAVRCDDAMIHYVNVTHEKAGSGIYYGYAHLMNPYSIIAQYPMEIGDLWGFVRTNLYAIIVSVFFSSLGFTASDEDEREVCILDYDNFKKIYCVDVEAG
ncbi:MAG: hypothetical protein K6E59_06500 [Bacilli bacterium]|nr:hypothetical protein [Bacilli bacterium]